MIDALLFSNNSKYEFDEKTHTYYYDGQKVDISVTSFIERYWPTFNLEKVSLQYAIKNNLDQQFVKDNWKRIGDIASLSGTIIHTYLENINSGKLIEDNYSSAISLGLESEVRDRVDKLKGKAISFAKDIKDKLIPLRLEYTVGYKTFIAGNIDMIAYNKKYDEIQIWDYKNCKQIDISSSWEKCFYPFNNYDSCNFVHYSIQLSMYKALLQRLCNIKVGNCYLVHFNYEEKGNDYHIYKCEDFTNICDKEIDKLNDK